MKNNLSRPVPPAVYSAESILFRGWQQAILFGAPQDTQDELLKAYEEAKAPRPIYDKNSSNCHQDAATAIPS